MNRDFSPLKRIFFENFQDKASEIFGGYLSFLRVWPRKIPEFSGKQQASGSKIQFFQRARGWSLAFNRVYCKCSEGGGSRGPAQLSPFAAHFLCSNLNKTTNTTNRANISSNSRSLEKSLENRKKSHFP